MDCNSFGLRRIALLGVFLVVVGAAASGQVITGEIDGIVRDPSGAVVPNATVQVYNTDTNALVRTLKANKVGEYNASQLQVGNYKVVVTSQGFQQSTLEGITLNVGDTLTEDVRLTVGTSDTTTVTIDSDKPNLETPENNTIINNTEINELALNTRNFEQMLLLQPGVSYGGPDELNVGQVDSSGQRSSHALSVNGLQPSQVVFQLDGSDMLNHATGGQVTSFPAIESIAQIQTVRNSYGAQYGGGGSAQIIVVTRAGGATFHGGGYWFYRNAGLNATPIQDLLDVPPVPKPDIHYDDFGAYVGGPVFIPRLYPRDKSKTFFFFSEQIKREVNYRANNIAFYPSTANLNGYFSGPACIQYAPPVGTANALCTMVTPKVTNSPYPGFNYQVPQPFDVTAQEYLKDIFLPSEIIGGQPNNPLISATELDQQSPGVLHETQELVRFDQQFSERLNGFVRYLFDPISQVIANGYQVGGHGYPGVGNSNLYTYGEDFLAHLTWEARPNAVVEGGFAYNPYQIKATPFGSILQSHSPDVHVVEPFVNTTGRIPSINILGANITSSGPLRDLAHTMQAFENTTLSLGKHTLYFGVNYERFEDAANQGTNNAGQFNFNENSGAINLATGVACTPLTGKACNTTQFNQSFADILVGYPTTFTQSSIDPVALPATNLYEAYIQDNWRATATFTLNSGVRYTIDQAAYDRGNHLGAFQPQAYVPGAAPAIGTQGTICTSNTLPGCSGQVPNPAYNSLNGEVQGGVNSPYGSGVNRTALVSFAPRVGFAWNVFGDGKTSLRGGYGIYFNTIDLVNYTVDVFNNAAYVQTPTYSAPLSFGSPGAGTSASNQVPVSSGINRNLKQPYTQSFSLGLQQQLSKYALLDISYVGNQTQHLIGEEDLNQPKPDLFLQTNVTGGAEVVPGNTYLLNSIRPYVGYGPITFIDSRYFADYNALQTSLTYHAGKKSVIGLHYTWSRAMSNSTGQPLNSGAAYVGPQNRYNLAPEWGPTVLDRRNMFVAHYIYQLPSHASLHGFVGGLVNGWEISGIAQIMAGFWFTANENTQDPAGQGTQANGSVAQGRPNQLSNPNVGGQRNIAMFFNTAAFKVQNTPGPPGSAQVGTIEGPGYATYNVDIFKNIELPENFRLQLRAEAFNVLNHVNYQNVGVVTNNAGSYGSVTSFYDNRTMQVGAKLYF